MGENNMLDSNYINKVKYLLSNLNNKLYTNFDLSSKHNFFKKAGNADFYYQLTVNKNVDEDLEILHKLYSISCPFKIFGSHTNLYITKKGYKGLFVDFDTKSKFIKF